MDDVVLWHVTHRATQLGEVRCRVDAVERDRSPVGRTDRRHRFEQRGLAGPAAADDRHQFTRLDRERDVVENTMAVANRLGQAANVDS